MAWADPRGDLRIQLADTPNDNLVKDQVVLPQITNGTQRRFFTFEDRLQTSGYQSVATKPLRLWYREQDAGPVELAASGILVTDPIRGEFEVMLPPSGVVEVRASYYYQKHLDTELDFYLQQAAYQVSVTAIADVIEGLRLACLWIAASLAHARLAERWHQRKSEQFMLQDAPMRSEADARVAFHQAESTRLRDEGLAARRAYYDLRQDRGRSPAWGLLKRTPDPYTPRR